MLRPVLPAILLLPALAAQTAPPAAAPHSDVASVGFLKSAVDRRLYSLEEAGALRLTGTAHATFEVIVPESPVKPAVLDIALSCDYASGNCDVQPIGPLKPEQSAIQPFAVMAAQNAFSRLPSHAAADWVTTLARDGDLVRIDYKLPQTAASNPAGWSEWYKADGTPVRRRVVSFVPNEPALPPITQEIKPSYVESSGRLLLVALKPADSDGRFSYDFEYEEKQGCRLLKRAVVQNVGWKLSLDFQLSVEKR